MEHIIEDVDLGVVCNLETLRATTANLRVGGQRWWVESDLEQALKSGSVIVGYGDRRCVDPLNSSVFAMPILNKLSAVRGKGRNNLLVVLHPSTLSSGEPPLFMDRCLVTDECRAYFEEFYYPLVDALARRLRLG